LGLDWQGSEYSLVLLTPGTIITASDVPLDTANLPTGVISESNYLASEYVAYDIEFFDGYNSSYPYKVFRVNNPGIGAWTYAIIEDQAPTNTEPVRVYMANESDLVLTFDTDQERYYIQYNQDGSPINAVVKFTATLFEGGEFDDGLGEHTQSVSTPVTNAFVVVRVTSPNGEASDREMDNNGDGTYTLSLETPFIGNYDVFIVGSDKVPGMTAYGISTYNSQYLITTEHSFYVSPFETTEDITGKLYIEWAKAELEAIVANNNLDNNTKRNINRAIGKLLATLDPNPNKAFFEVDGNHLKDNKGLSFYDNITSSVNYIYSYIGNLDYGDNIELAILDLYQGSLFLAETARNEAEIAINAGDCQLSNCDETLKNANAEIGKAIDESKQNNYVYIFNHLTNAWKFSMNILGANLKKEGGESITVNIPTVYSLEQNYPNPFNPSTTINYQLPEKNHVKLAVFDILGNLVGTLIDQEMEAGYHSVNWNASGYASGIYFYTINSGSFVMTKKLVLMK
jgi:hypothetical protein